MLPTNVKKEMAFLKLVLCFSLLSSLLILNRMPYLTPTVLGRFESDDVYEGEWNLQRDQQVDFPGKCNERNYLVSKKYASAIVDHTLQERRPTIPMVRVG